jgi:hypothetical protein
MKEIRTEIEIRSSPEKVWGILTDFSKFTDWNPFIQLAKGKAKMGEKVDITLFSGEKDMTLHCIVLKAESSHELSWQYHVGFPFLWKGVHSFTIDPIGPNRVRFIDKEFFSGLLISLQGKDSDATTRRDFENMDKALKARAEQK